MFNSRLDSTLRHSNFIPCLWIREKAVGADTSPRSFLATRDAPYGSVKGIMEFGSFAYRAIVYHNLLKVMHKLYNIGNISPSTPGITSVWLCVPLPPVP